MHVRRAAACNVKHKPRKGKLYKFTSSHPTCEHIICARFAGTSAEFEAGTPKMQPAMALNVLALSRPALGQLGLLTGGKRFFGSLPSNESQGAFGLASRDEEKDKQQVGVAHQQL